MTTLKWAQNRISTINDLVKTDLAFLWIVPSSVTNIKQTELFKCAGTSIVLYKRYFIQFTKYDTFYFAHISYYHIIIDTIKLLNTELAEIDVKNYKTDWLISYLRHFADKKKIPFPTLMKGLRSMLSGLKVNMVHSNYFRHRK